MTDPMTHYERYQSEYNQIAKSLDTVRESFVHADRFTQKAMLFDSMVYAVTSVQNDISVLRTAFRGYRNADSWDDLDSVFGSVNYGNNKLEYIKSNRDTVFGKRGSEMIDALERDNPAVATQIAVNNLDGVSYIKAPFIFAMLGFTSMMCIDTNVAQMVPDKRVKASGYTSGPEYWEAVRRVEAEFPDLADEVSRFMLQWVVFDVNRGMGVAKHEEWFEAMLPGTEFGRQTSLDSY